MDAEVPSIIPATVLRVASRMGFDVDVLVSGLGFSREGLRRPGVRVHWNDVAALFQRLEDEKPGCMNVFAEGFGESLPLLSWVASYAGTAQTFYRAVAEGSKRVWYFMDCTFHRQSDGRIEWTASLPEPLNECEPFFRAMTTLLRVMPRQVNVADATVVADVGPRHGRWLVTLPIQPTLPAKKRVSNASRLFADIAREMMEVAAPRKNGKKVSWPLTASEHRVVELLALGKSTKEIAEALDVTVETVRSHLKRSMGKLGVHRQHELVVKVLDRKRRSSR